MHTKKTTSVLLLALCLAAANPLAANAKSLPLSATIPEELQPELSGTFVEKTEKAEIDYSNVSDGYVLARFSAPTDKRIKVQVDGPTRTYNYEVPAGKWGTFPLSDGNGTYKVTVAENIADCRYSVEATATFQVVLEDEFSPFLRPNQYVDYGYAPNTVDKAKELTAGITDPLLKVEKIYNYVVENLTYDDEKATTITSSYLPVLDEILATKKGICFDYASLMAGMLRSQEVPCRLVVGYAGNCYHAWIDVWTESSGWINNMIYFDGTTWQRMDPTFASASNSSNAIVQYIGDGTHYTVKYMY